MQSIFKIVISLKKVIGNLPNCIFTKKKSLHIELFTLA